MIEMVKCVQKKSEAIFLVNFVIELHNNSFDLLGRETVKNNSVILVYKGLPTPLYRLPPKKNSEKNLKTVFFSQETFFVKKLGVA